GPQPRNASQGAGARGRQGNYLGGIREHARTHERIRAPPVSIGRQTQAAPGRDDSSRASGARGSPPRPRQTTRDEGTPQAGLARRAAPRCSPCATQAGRDSGERGGALLFSSSAGISGTRTPQGGPPRGHRPSQGARVAGAGEAGFARRMGQTGAPALGGSQTGYGSRRPGRVRGRSRDRGGTGGSRRRKPARRRTTAQGGVSHRGHWWRVPRTGGRRRPLSYRP